MTGIKTYRPIPTPPPSASPSTSASTPSPDGQPAPYVPSIDVLSARDKAAIQATLGGPPGPRAIQPKHDWTKLPSTKKPAVALDNKWWDKPVEKLTKQAGKDMWKATKWTAPVAETFGVDKKDYKKAVQGAPKAGVNAGLEAGVDAATQPAKDASVGPTNPTDHPAERGTYEPYKVPGVGIPAKIKVSF